MDYYDGEPKDRDWLKRKVIALFENASQCVGEDPPAGAEPDHPVCVKYAEILMKLLPGTTRGSHTNDHPDASLIEAVRKAVQGATP